MSVGENIKKCRQKQGLTQKQLGSLCDIAESTIRRYELGKLKPKYETIQKIAKALQVNITDLVPDFLDIRFIQKSNIHEMELLLEQLPEMNIPDKSKTQYKKYAESQIDKSEKMINALQVLDLLNEHERELLKNFSFLNNKGKEKAIEHVELLTRIPEFKKEKNEE